MKNVLFGCVVLATVTACSPANFFGSSDKREGDRTPAVTPQPQTPPPGPATPPKEETPPVTSIIVIERPTTPPGETEQELKIDAIADQQVNTGGISSRYSELLEVPVIVSGGSGNITLQVESQPASPTLGLAGQKLSWRPGHYGGGSYANEAGDHTVIVSATDSAGKSITAVFKTRVTPVDWKSKVIAHTNKDNMEFQYEITERLHPERRYKHSSTYDGMNLNAQTCVSFTHQPDLKLTSGPTFSDGQPPSIQSGAFVHANNVKMVSPIASQPHDNTVFVTWLNFLSVDGATVAQEDNGIFIYYAYSRCRDTKMSVSECKKASISSNNMDNFYYCSEYFPQADRKAFLKDLFCGFARLHKVSAPGCP